MSARLLSLVLCCLLGSGLLAQPEAIFEQANADFQAGRYRAAISRYEAILAEGWSSASLHYNLGNAYYRSDSIGAAILHYEKAGALGLRSADLRHNLDLANSRIEDPMPPLRPTLFQLWQRHVAGLLRSSYWAVLALLAAWGAAYGFYLWRFAPLRQRRAQGFWAGAAALLAALALLYTAYVAMLQAQRSDYAIVMAERCRVVSNADAGSGLLIVAPEGTKLHLLDRIGDWCKVRLPNGEQGWVQAGAISDI